MGFQLTKSKVEVGSIAPDFILPSQSGQMVSLKDFVGEKPVVLFFYPKDDTPGSTKEACAFRDDHDGFGKLEAEVIGISSDVQKFLQISILSLRGFHGCSLLFAQVGVKLVSTDVAISLPRRTPSWPMLSCSSSKNVGSRRADSSWDEAARCRNRSRTTRTRVCSPQLPSGPRSSRRWADPTHHLGQSVG